MRAAIRTQGPQVWSRSEGPKRRNVLHVVHAHQLPEQWNWLKSPALRRRRARDDAGAILVAPDIDDVVRDEVCVARWRRDAVKQVAARLQELALFHERVEVALPTPCQLDHVPMRMNPAHAVCSE